MLVLFDSDKHKNVMFDDLADGFMVQSNQHIIVHNGEAMLLDPGGHKIYSKLFSGLSDVIKKKDLRYIFFSHQDPDIVAAANGWLMISDATAYISELWIRFIPHFGVDKFVATRIKSIPDRGIDINLGGVDLKIIPAHFLHSAGNFQVYDPVSKILYSGDVGTSLGANYCVVEDFDEHIKYIEDFHKRYMSSNKAINIWLKAIGNLDIEMIVPQHGAVYKGKSTSYKFLQWMENLSCGLDLME